MLIRVSDTIRPKSLFSRAGHSGRAKREETRCINQRGYSRSPACIQYVAKTIQVCPVELCLVGNIAGDERRAVKNGPTALHLSGQSIGIGKVSNENLVAWRLHGSTRTAH